MKLLTFDIEEWYNEYKRGGRKEKFAQYDHYLDAVLKKLDERNLKATFFCVGEMARLFPDILKRIQSHGHEIGCHSNAHEWLNKMSMTECREDTRIAVDSLEQCTGAKVRSYRAPAFSIGEDNKWAFEILAENGIERDASIFPAKRAFGGFPDFGKKVPSIVEYNGCRVKEFPVPTAKVLWMEVAYSGGGYFRFFPLDYVKWKIAHASYAMCYFHVLDISPESSAVPSRIEYERYYKEPGTFKNRYLRHLKTNLGKKSALQKLSRLLDAFDFVGLDKADDIIDWNSVPVVTL